MIIWHGLCACLNELILICFDFIVKCFKNSLIVGKERIKHVIDISGPEVENAEYFIVQMLQMKK